MSVRIRLARAGAKKRPYYHIVVADSRSPRDGKFLDRIGHYNPLLEHADANRLHIDADKAKHWLGVGALPTDRVARFLSQQSLIAAPSRAEQTKKNQPKEKAVQRAKEKQEALEAAKAAAEAPAEAPVESSESENAPAPETA